MMKKIIIMVFILVLLSYKSLASISAYDTGAGVLALAIHEEDTIYDASITAYIYGLDSYGKTNINKISSGKTTLLYLDMDIPKEAQGFYPVRITLSGDDIRLKTHAWVWLN